jgi:hypothetical protein
MEATERLCGDVASELIRLVRLCKTAAEERAAVAKECAAIRTAFKRNVRALYCLPRRQCC